MKSKKRLLNVLCIICALVFFGSGVAKLIQLPEITQFLMKLNYKGQTVMIILGIVEIIGAIGVFFSYTRFYTTILLIIIMVTAIGSQIGAGLELKTILIPSALFCLLSYIAYLDNSIAAQEEEEEIEQTGTLTHSH
jgi:hypothetical protein